MEAIIKYSEEELARIELRKFLDEGLQDVSRNQLLDFDETFDELEKRYSDNG
jgi:hypothetical protein